MRTLTYVNRVAVVTGGASGIGREVARGVGRSRGAAVAVADINLEGAEEVAAALAGDGARTEAIAVDVRRPEQANAMIACTIEAFGKVDILVHSAGVGVERSFLDTSPEEWQRILDIDLSGTFFCGQAAARHMVEARLRPPSSISHRPPACAAAPGGRPTAPPRAASSHSPR